MAATQAQRDNALIEAYQEAQLDVLQAIETKALIGSPYEYEELLAMEIDQILRGLGVDTRKWLKETVPSLYERTAKEVMSKIAPTQTSLLPQMGEAFAGVNQAAVRAITDNIVETADTALWTAGRRLNDQIRAAGVEATQKMLTLNQTVREMQRDLSETLREQGYALGVPDTRGRVMPVESYAKMVARTTTRETTNTATIETAHRLNANLFQLTEHYPTCKLCAPRQGRVYRDADFPEGDERNRFPHISMAFPNWPTYKTVHVNCRHVLTPVGFGALSRETQLKMLERADEPFDLDPRSEKEIAAYNDSQNRQRRMREDRKQWDRYKNRLGEDAPKTFSAFRRIKNADGESWRNLNAKYRQANREYGIIEIAKVPDGKHYGKLVDMERWPDKQLERGINSYTKTIESHIQKMIDPRATVPDWDSKDTRERNGILFKWQKDIDNNFEQRAIAQYILREREKK